MKDRYKSVNRRIDEQIKARAAELQLINDGLAAAQAQREQATKDKELAIASGNRESFFKAGQAIAEADSNTEYYTAQLEQLKNKPVFSDLQELNNAVFSLSAEISAEAVTDVAKHICAIYEIIEAARLELKNEKVVLDQATAITGPAEAVTIRSGSIDLLKKLDYIFVSAFAPAISNNAPKIETPYKDLKDRNALVYRF